MAKKSNAVLNVRIISDAKKANDGFKKASSGADKFSSQMKKAATGLAAALGFKKVVTELFELGAAFDKTWKDLRIGTGATGDDFAALQDSVRKVASETPGLSGGIDQISSTLGDLNTRLGLTGPDLEAVAKQFVNLSNLGIDADIDAVSAAFNAFGIEAKDIPDTLDKFMRVSQDTGLSVTELANSAVKGGPGLRAFGFDISDSAALIGTMDKAGINADSTISRLSRAFGEFAEAGLDPQEALRDTVTEIEAFIEAGDLGAAEDMASKLFGTRGAVQFMDAVQSGVLSVEDFAAAAGTGSDTINGLAEEVASFPEKWQLFKQSAALALEPLAETIFNAVEVPLGAAGSAIQENSELFGVIGTAIGVFIGILTAAKVAMMLFNAVMAMNPVLLVVTAVIALGVALVVAYNQSETFRNIIDKIGAFGKAIFDGIAKSVKALGDGIGDVISWVGRLIDRIRSISFPSPPAWMSNLFGETVMPHDSVLGIPRDSGVFRFMAPPAATFAGSPDITAAGSWDVIPDIFRAFGGRRPGAGSGGEVSVDNSIHITVDGSGIVDPRKVADSIRAALTGDARTRGLAPAAGKGRMWL